MKLNLLHDNFVPFVQIKIVIIGIVSIPIDSIHEVEEPFVAHTQERDPVPLVTAVARVSFEGGWNYFMMPYHEFIFA